MNIYQRAAQFRRELLQMERPAAAEMVSAYGDAWLRIRDRLDELLAQIPEATDAGKTVSQGWLFRGARLKTLLEQVESEIRTFARTADGLLTTSQQRAVGMALQHAEQLYLAGLEPATRAGVFLTFNRLPVGAVQQLVGFTVSGSPLRALFDELGPGASKDVRKALLNGIVLGRGPRAIAREVKRTLGGNLVRALTIARTETLRSYREAGRLTYEENDDVVKGWRWVAAADRRTCAFCWAMDGTVHKLDEPMATHPNCRCTQVPVTKTLAELGIAGADVAQPAYKPGTERFAELDEAEQLQILGPAKFAAYRDKRITLTDLAGFRRDPRWGKVGFEKSLTAILGADKAKRHRRATGGRIAA